MEIKKLQTWEDFKREIIDIYSYYNKLQSDHSPMIIHYPIFRGQSSSSWHLHTTLERLNIIMSCEEYFQKLHHIKRQYESFTNSIIDLPEYKEISRDPYSSPLGYNFMATLRHLQFPSPLLDWTKSPYIAAFFAFNDFYRNDDVAIFMYFEHITGVKTWWGDGPLITIPGPNIKTNIRHYLQQSDYSFCTKIINEIQYYSDHGEVFYKQNNDQDILIKYIIPNSEKKIALQELNLMNINEYSLFNSEESLLKTIALKHLILNDT